MQIRKMHSPGSWHRCAICTVLQKIWSVLSLKTSRLQRPIRLGAHRRQVPKADRTSLWHGQHTERSQDFRVAPQSIGTPASSCFLGGLLGAMATSPSYLRCSACTSVRRSSVSACGSGCTSTSRASETELSRASTITASKWYLCFPLLHFLQKTQDAKPKRGFPHSGPNGLIGMFHEVTKEFRPAPVTRFEDGFFGFRTYEPVQARTCLAARLRKTSGDCMPALSRSRRLSPNVRQYISPATSWTPSQQCLH